MEIIRKSFESNTPIKNSLRCQFINARRFSRRSSYFLSLTLLSLSTTLLGSLLPISDSIATEFDNASSFETVTEDQETEKTEENTTQLSFESGPYLTLGIQQIQFESIEEQKFDRVSESYVGLGYQLTNHWSAQLSFLTSQVTDSDTIVSDVDYLNINSKYRFNGDKNNGWYVNFGIGQFQFEGSTVFPSNELELNVGGGYDFHLNRNLFISLNTQAIFPQNRKNTDWSTSISLNYFFGEESVEKTLSDSFSLEHSQAEKNKPITDSKSEKPLDSDHDGIDNNQDQCPETPYHFMVDQNGCTKYVIDRQSIVLNIQFDSDSILVKEEYYDDIESLARFMKQHQTINVTIEGHTDNVGAKNYNRRLSSQRANQVAKILNRDFGITLKKINSIGYGETKPVATNLSDEGRSQNRRVQAVLKAEVQKPQLKKTNN
ncbi:OmpA family protein [Aliikangiella coralliicola]|uniref:OmpA family protein n=1 Tax=Aliikangiella coralliicola TaxID=2592383 RepID=A0A545UB77_9GAMM|nr:OmpA family protein [Aliikangiella coralliicola]TQV86683.1 OmpA family protein [Aliikangiella coralliicola]